MNERRLLLSGYDVKRCARRVHNDHDPDLNAPDHSWSPDFQARIDAGLMFESAVFMQLSDALGSSRCHRIPESSGDRDRVETIRATLAAMEAGIELIVGGQLPDDWDGGRKGRPDLLLRVDGGG